MEWEQDYVINYQLSYTILGMREAFTNNSIRIFSPHSILRYGPYREHRKWYVSFAQRRVKLRNCVRSAESGA